MNGRRALACVASSVFLACTSPFGVAADAAANLIRNGGFEDGSEGWSWGQWKGLPEPGYVDRDAPHSGAASYVMSLAGTEGERMIYTSVSDIDHESDYELELFLRGRDLETGAASVNLLQWGTEQSTEVKPQGWVTMPERPGDMRLIAVGGTFDWRRSSVHIHRQSIKASTKRLTLYIRHASIGRGELGIDDVSLVSVVPAEYRRPAKAVELPPAPPAVAAKPVAADDTSPDTGPRVEAATSEVKELLLDRCDSTRGWALQLGQEFAGAQGELTAVRDGRRDVLRVAFDLSGGGRYVGAQRDATLEEAESILFDLHTSGLESFNVRIRDSTGQVHSAPCHAEKGAWRTISLPLTKEVFSGHWSGAKDGKIHFPLRRVLIAAVPAEGGRGDFLLRNFGVRRTGPGRTWGMSVVTDQPGHIHFLDEPKVNVWARVLNRLREERAVPVAVRVVDLEGKIVTSKQEIVRFAPWTPMTVDLSCASPGPGHFHVRVAVGAGRSAEKDEGAFGVVPRPLRYRERDPESFFGMHSVDPDIAPRIGVHWYRYYHMWRYRELHRGMYSHVTEELQRCVHAGIDVMMCLDYREPSWLKPRTGSDGLPTEEALRDYAAFVRAAVRAHPGVAAFEIQNEPDLELMAHRNLPLARGVEFYTRIVNTVAPIIGEQAPGIPIVGANVSGQDQNNGFPFCRAVFDRVGERFDIWAPHPYASPRTFGPGLAPLFPEGNREAARHQETLELIRETGLSHRYWIGEKGWEIRDEAPLAGKISRAFADCAARSLVIAKSVPGVEKYFWFVLQQEYSHGSKYTLFRGKPLQPMPAAVAYANVAHHLDHTRSVGSLHLAGGRIRACVFERKETDTAVAVLWCVNVPFVLDADLPADAQASDMYGRALTAKRLPLSETPLFVRTSAAQAEALLAALGKARFETARPFEVAGAYLHDVRTLRVDLLNNTSGVVRLDGRADGATGRIALLPGREAPVHFDIALPRPANEHGATPLPFTLTPRQGKPVELSVTTALLPVVRRAGIVVDAEASDWDGTEPVVLNARHQVLPPDNAGWNGPDDLSMRLHLAWDDESLFLLVRVTDDTHSTPNSVQFWKSDALQVAFDVMNDAADVPSYDDNDREYGAMVDADGAHAYQTHPPGSPRFRLAAKRLDDQHQTLYEMAFPWSELGRTAKAGMVFSLNLTASDNDGAGMNYWIGLTPGIVEGKRPSLYRDVFLAE